MCEALGSRGFRDREKTSSSGFFLLLPSQGTEGQRRTQREGRTETRTRNKDCLEKNNIKQTLDRSEVGCGGLHSLEEKGYNMKSKQESRALGNFLYSWGLVEQGLLHLCDRGR